MTAERRSDPEEIGFLFEGREIRCARGVSLAAALTAAGELELRDAAAAGRRGLFCGMGVCQECRVNVDGRAGVRACMAAAEDALHVSRGTQHVSTQADEHPVVGRNDIETLTPDILVIGAGPGGLVAASVAAEAGADVVVLDERSTRGGQYFKQPASAEVAHASLAGDRQYAEGKRLIERMLRSGARILSGAELWGAFAPNEFAVFDGERSTIYKPRCAIVATGAYERGLPLPGWTLPGVMTTGAAQGLLRSYGTLPGKRILVAGNGPLNLQVALELKRAGADAVAVAELATRPGPGSFVTALRMGLSAPGLAVNGIRYLAGLMRSGVPVLYGQGLASVEKTPAGLKANVGPVGANGIEATTSYDVDVVCMGYGFQPNNEILRSLGCRHDYDERRGHLVTKRSAECETSVAGIYAIGDCAGFRGAASALQDGVIAATAAVQSLHGSVPVELEKRSRQAARTRRRHERFQTALWTLFAAPRFHAQLAAPDTPICRCEDVRLRDIEAAIADDGYSVGTLKRLTRLGMGACQGRYCAPVAAHLIAARNGCPLDEFSYFAPRSPLKPIRIGDILAVADD